MSQQFRLAPGNGRMQRDENRQKFNNLRKNHQLNNHSIKIIGNRNGQNNRPVKILTARKANQEALTGRAAKIAKNLQHMKLAAQKKRQAQEHYYGQGKSSVARTNPGSFKAQNNRMSVQHRLGQNNVSNQNTNRKQFVPNNKQAKIIRVQNYTKKQQRAQIQMNRNKSKNAVKTVSLLTGEVKYLRPLNKKVKVESNVQRPANFMVCVENSKHLNRSEVMNGVSYKHHVYSDLNPAIQQEIRMIQNKAPVVSPSFINTISSVPSTEPRVPIMATKTTLHERFSMI